MKSSLKKIIIFLAIIFLLLIYAGLRTHNSHNEDQVISSEDQKNISGEKGEDKKNFEIEDLSHEEKKQIEESLGYEISEIKHIKFFEDEDYIKQEVKNKEGYIIEDISEVKNVVEFNGDYYQSICDNKENEEVTIKLGEKKFKNDYMADLPIDAKIISNALGFDVKREVLIDLDLDIKVEGKTFATASLYPEIDSYDFKIINKDGEVRKGSAKKLVGVYLIVRKEQINEI
ncbi:hypothetical protein [Peptoniphilus sp. HMSC062D09]|uniref:hypothetical protein n=1 Tax=Peptoniphilus TaxID=162289 RepID=UPI0008A50E3B|nr:hypothetical protein [Peptoniphilus sp. HMSC062D09]OFK78372.1 hypothetical protein HMPREF2801_08915 [Peptoniphilus sp. HMSC062D09]